MDWNVVITGFDQRGLRHARRFLERYGELERTPFYNVLVLKVPDIDQFMKRIAEPLKSDVSLLNDVSRLVPTQETFDFDTVAAFEEKALAIALGWADRLADQSFHVRLHRRQGQFPVRLPTLAEERALDEALLRKLTEIGRPGRINFDDPDFIIDIETVGNRAGMSIWSRADRSAFPFLRLD